MHTWHSTKQAAYSIKIPGIHFFSAIKASIYSVFQSRLNTYSNQYTHTHAHSVHVFVERTLFAVAVAVAVVIVSVYERA